MFYFFTFFKEYRDERHTSLQTEGNKAAADVLREVNN